MSTSMSLIFDMYLRGMGKQIGVTPGECRWLMSEVTRDAIKADWVSGFRTLGAQVSELKKPPFDTMYSIKVVLDNSLLFGEVEFVVVSDGSSVCYREGKDA